MSHAAIEESVGDLLRALAKLPPEAGFVYFIADGDAVKIGMAQDPERRLADLQVGNPRLLTLLGGMPGAIRAEMMVHRRFEDWRIRGEWFALDAPGLRELITYWDGWSLEPRGSECCDVLVIRGRCCRCGERA